MISVMDGTENTVEKNGGGGGGVNFFFPIMFLKTLLPWDGFENLVGKKRKCW